jgi:hypothetical protein
MKAMNQSSQYPYLNKEERTELDDSLEMLTMLNEPVSPVFK